jgi:hypothetical protein
MQIKTANFEIDVHDSPDGYYVDVKTKSQLVSVFQTHVVVYAETRSDRARNWKENLHDLPEPLLNEVVREIDRQEGNKILVHVHTVGRKIQVAKEMEIDTTNEP